MNGTEFSMVAHIETIAGMAGTFYAMLVVVCVCHYLLKFLFRLLMMNAWWPGAAFSGNDDGTRGVETKRTLYRRFYVLSFLSVNTAIVFAVYLFIKMYEIDYREALYAVAALAVLLAIFGGSLYVPYLEGLKLVVDGRLKYLECYDLYDGGRLSYENVRVRRINSFYVLLEWNGGKMYMGTGSLASRYDIVHRKKT